MKNTLLLTAFLFIFQFGKAQTYIPFVEDSMIVINQEIISYYGKLYIYKYIGDTTIASKVYKRVYKNSNFSDSSFTINANLTYFGAIRELNKKVYFVFKDSMNEKKIYDFNLTNYGDSTYLYYRKVNKYLKTKLIWNDTLFCDTTGRIWSEIDSLFGFMDNTSYFIPGFGYDIPYYDLENELTSRLCVYRKSKNHNKCHNNSYLDCMRSTYITENKLTKNNLNLHPNPTNNTISIQTDENRTINKINIFSINGKLIKSFQFKITEKPENLSVIKLPSGIYFVQVIGDDFVGSLKFVKE